MLKIDRKAQKLFHEQLAKKLQQAVGNAVPVVQEVTPIDTMRLYASTRAEEPVIEDKRICCDLVAGGIALHGILKEQTLKRDVDYALDIELRYHYIRGNIQAIEAAILEGLEQ